MKKFLKSFRYGQRGFTLIELLIVVAILGILAAILIPSLSGFLGTANVAAANSEVATVKTAAAAYYSDNDGTWPGSSADLFSDTVTIYLDKPAEAEYSFEPTTGRITGVTDPGKWGTPGAGLFFWASDQQWHKTLAIP